MRYQGVVCSLKESFGFIERGDVVREIFFHFSEAKGISDSLKLGDDVEFTIQTRNVSLSALMLYLLFFLFTFHRLIVENVFFSP